MGSGQLGYFKIGARTKISRGQLDAYIAAVSA
jgi:hypothetical protein